MYQEELLNHYHRPRNQGRLEHPDFSCSRLNPLCGDQVMYEGAISDGTISDLKFTGSGCVISQATASLLGEHVRGKKIETVLSLDKVAVLSLIGISLGPTRMQCALLPLEALQQGINEYLKRSINA